MNFAYKEQDPIGMFNERLRNINIWLTNLVMPGFWR